MDFINYINIFQKLNTGRPGKHTKPHKPAMLLSIMILIEIISYLSYEIITYLEEVQKKSEDIGDYRGI